MPPTVDPTSLVGLSREQRLEKLKGLGLKLGERLRIESAFVEAQLHEGSSSNSLPAADISDAPAPAPAGADKIHDDAPRHVAENDDAWPDACIVVHAPRVAVRNGPSLSASLVGARSSGSELYGCEQKGWLRLCGEAERWVLIDGRPHGLPLLLRRLRSCCEPFAFLGGRRQLVEPALSFLPRIRQEEIERDGRFRAGALPGLPLRPPTLLRAPLGDVWEGSWDQDDADVLLRTIARRGFCLCSTGLSAGLVAAARREVEELNSTGAMVAGDVGGNLAPGENGLRLPSEEMRLLGELEGAGRAHGLQVRSDHCLFLSHHLNGLDTSEKAPPPPPPPPLAPPLAPTFGASSSATTSETRGPSADGDGDDAVSAEQRAASCPTLSRIQHLMIQLGNALGARLEAAPRDAARYPMRFASDESDPPSVRGHSDLQVSCYRNPTAQYRIHVDNVGGAKGDGRLLTMLLYLNDDVWTEADGGALRLHLPVVVSQREGLQPNECTPFVDVCPGGGTLAIFRSDRVWHEVRPPKRPRYAVTSWVLAHDPPPGAPRCYF